MACDVAGPDKDELLAQHGGNPPRVRGRLPQPYLTSLTISHRRLNMVDYAARYSLRPARSSRSEVLVRQVDIHRGDILFEMRDLRGPGIGRMTGLRLSIQASAIWPGVASWALAMPSRIEPGTIP